MTPVVFYMDQPISPVRSAARGIDRNERARRIRSNPVRAEGIRAGRQRLERVIASLNPESQLLSSLRLRAGLSQAELAQRLNMKQPNVARLEKRPGDLGLSMLRKLQVAFNVPLEEVIAAVDYTNQTNHEHP